MFKTRLSLRLFSTAIANSITKANEMLEVDHKIATQRYKSDQFDMIMPPPPPLIIKNVRVKFSGNISKPDHEKESDELFLDLNKPNGNFSAEMEFAPFPEEMLKAAKYDSGENIPFAAKPTNPMITTEPQPITELPVEPEPLYENTQTPYDTSDTPRNYNLDV